MMIVSREVRWRPGGETHPLLRMPMGGDPAHGGAPRRTAIGRPCRQSAPGGVMPVRLDAAAPAAGRTTLNEPSVSSTTAST
jgi:hypothetical protein